MSVVANNVKVPKILTPQQRMKKAHRRSQLKIMTRNWQLYILVLPALAYFLIFCYVPMYGVQIAFKDYIATKGILGSPWVGLKHFEMFFSIYSFKEILWNTISLSIYSLVAGFPIPIILALLLNEVNSTKFKKLVQNITYAPHFISTVVLVGMLQLFFSHTGVVNAIIRTLGGETTLFLTDSKLFNDMYVWSGVWQGMGWGSIIYLAALAGVSPELHEAATVDGATRLQRIWHINIPSILPTMVIMLILNSGSIMNVGFEKVYLMQNNLNTDTSEVISTYTYKMGLINAKYSYSSAVGLFNTIVNFILLITVNSISKKVTETSLW